MGPIQYPYVFSESSSSRFLPLIHEIDIGWRGKNKNSSTSNLESKRTIEDKRENLELLRNPFIISSRSSCLACLLMNGTESSK